MRRARTERVATPALAAFGLFAVAVGVLFNDVTYTFFLTPNVSASPRTQAIIWVLDLALVVGGALLVRQSRVAWASNAALLVVTTVAFVLLMEGFFAELRARTAKPDVYEGDHVTIGHAPDPRLGDKPKPSTRTSHAHKVGGETAFDVHYTIDEHSRRVTPQSDLADRTQFLLFFGCSFTFGLGVEDDQTLPFYAAEEAPRYHAYNYAFAGYGTQQMLMQLRREEMRAEIAEPEGIAVYVFIDHHVDRVTGRSDALWGYLWDGPYFTLDDGELTYRGGFRWNRTAQSLINYAVSRSHTLGYFNRSFSPVTDASLDLTARIIVEARDAFAAKFGSDAFYVVFYPQAWRAPTMIARLEPAGVKVLDYSHLFDGLAENPFIPDDGHPGPAGHRIVARRLVSDLGLSE